MIEFVVAAESAEIGEDEEVVKVPIEDKVYLARRPTVAQTAFLALTIQGDGVTKLSATFQILESLIGAEGVNHIQRLVLERRIDIDDLVGGSKKNKVGLVDSIFKEFTKGRPTQPSSISSSSPGTTGRKSTGRSPGKGSTHSPSPSTGS